MSALTNREAIAAVCNSRHFMQGTTITRHGELTRIWRCTRCGAVREFGADDVMEAV